MVEIDELDYSLGHLSPPEFIVTTRNFADSLLNEEYFMSNWVDFVTHPRDLKVMIEAYSEAHFAFEKDGGKTKQNEVVAVFETG